MKKSLLLVIVLLLFQAGLCRSAEEALVLHLKFDEGSGEVARDSSGRAHDARLVQPVWEEFGLQGKALRLNGENAYIELPLHEDFDQLRNFTFSLWFKAEKY